MPIPEFLGSTQLSSLLKNNTHVKYERWRWMKRENRERDRRKKEKNSYIQRRRRIEWLDIRSKVKGKATLETEKKEDKENRVYKRSRLVTVTLNTKSIIYFGWFHFDSWVYHIFCMSLFLLLSLFMQQIHLWICLIHVLWWIQFDWWTCVKTVSLNSLNNNLFHTFTDMFF